MSKKVSAQIGEHTINFETGKMAKQANGSVVVSCGDTMVLVTVVAEKEGKNLGFLPLTIEYQEKMYAAGRIPGSYFRREIGRPSEKEILTCRLIDRPLRPLFPDGYSSETQLIATVFSADQQVEPDILAMNGASMALLLSDIPFDGPVAAARVCSVNGQCVLNPIRAQQEKANINLVVAGTRNAVVMVEGKALEASEEEVLEAIFFAHSGIQPLLDAQLQLQAEAGQTKRVVVPPEVDESLREKVELIAKDGMAEVVAIAEKMSRSERYAQLKDEVTAQLAEEAGENAGQITSFLDSLRKKVMRSQIVEEGKRLDGRSYNDVRPITCEVGILPRAHGSALFTRGETQALVISTLGSERDEQHLEGLAGDVYRRFMLHYHYAFVEYAGSNMVHWNFENALTQIDGLEDNGLSARAIASDMLLIADADTDKGNRIPVLTSELGEDKFCLLKVKEIENTLPKELITKVAKSRFERMNTETKEGFNINQLDQNPTINFHHHKNGIGKILDNHIRTQGTDRKKLCFAEASGTIKYKLQFCHEIITLMDEPEWTLTEAARDLAQTIFKHIEQHNS